MILIIYYLKKTLIIKNKIKNKTRHKNDTIEDDNTYIVQSIELNKNFVFIITK